MFCFTGISIFLAKKVTKIPYYFQINEFLDLDIVDVTSSTLLKKLNSIRIRKHHLLTNISNFAKLDAKCPNLYKVKNIIFQKNFKALDYNQDLFTLYSSKFNFRCIMKIDV